MLGSHTFFWLFFFCNDILAYWIRPFRHILDLWFKVRPHEIFLHDIWQEGNVLRGGVILSLQFVCVSVYLSVCLSVRLCLCVFHVCNQGEITSLLQRSKGCSKLAGVSYVSGYWHTAIVNCLVVSVKFNESVPSGN